MTPAQLLQCEYTLLDHLKGFQSRVEYRKVATRLLKQHGHLVRYAEYDRAGNCVTCGEAGRCPGVHIVN